MSHSLDLPPVGTCGSGKQRFHDLVDAEAFAQVLAGKNTVTGQGKAGKPLRPYWCEACQAWHVGHATRGGAR